MEERFISGSDHVTSRSAQLILLMRLAAASPSPPAVAPTRRGASDTDGQSALNLHPCFATNILTVVLVDSPVVAGSSPHSFWSY